MIRRLSITLIAMNACVYGQPLVDRLQPSKTTERLKFCGIVIGVGDYPTYDKSLQLRYSSDDAKFFEHALMSPLGLDLPSKSIVFLNGKVSRSDILESLETNTLKCDQVFFFFSGHGEVDATGTFFFMPSDGRPDLPQVNGISLETLVRSIATKFEPNILWLFVDACRGATGIDRAGAFRADVSRPGLVTDSLILAFVSSNSSEESYEYSRLRHGLFSFYLSECFSGRACGSDGKSVDVAQLTKFVKSSAQEFAKAEHREPQTPIFFPRALENSALPVVPMVASRVEDLDIVVYPSTIYSPTQVDVAVVSKNMYELVLKIRDGRVLFSQVFRSGKIGLHRTVLVDHSTTFEACGTAKDNSKRCKTAHVDFRDRERPEPPTNLVATVVEVDPREKQDWLEDPFARVPFEHGSARLEEVWYRWLNINSKFFRSKLEAFPSWMLVLESEYQEDELKSLAEERLRAVQSLLEDLGVPSARITVVVAKGDRSSVLPSLRDEYGKAISFSRLPAETRVP